MDSDPVDLDGRRSAAGRMAADIRRRELQELVSAGEAERREEEAFEAQLLAGSAESWTEVAARAQYLIRLYAMTEDAQEPRRRKLIERALDDLARLIDREAPA